MNTEQVIYTKYVELCDKKSDINEHLPTLCKYASKCESIIECGVRRCVSSWALANGLLQNNSPVKKLLLNDIQPCNIDDFLLKTNGLGIDVSYQWCSNVEMELEQNYDMVFIDTWHVYGQLKRELNAFGKKTNKYIVMHDTEIDGVYGESVRNKHDVAEKMEMFGMTREEVTTGLQPAIDEFLASNPEWKVCEVFTNNNGLTILER
jgi:predicted O-methyltransferase YrrM